MGLGTVFGRIMLDWLVEGGGARKRSMSGLNPRPKVTSSDWSEFGERLGVRGKDIDVSNNVVYMFLYTSMGKDPI